MKKQKEKCERCGDPIVATVTYFYGMRVCSKCFRYLKEYKILPRGRNWG